ncbi:MAG: DUF3540 domain-containing protein [Planctomycetota bacterium]
MIDTGTLLQAARITPAQGPKGQVHVRFQSGEEGWARLALAFSYAARAGDEVLVIGQDPSELYVIGVLRGSGPTTLAVPGDLAITAPHGAITLKGKRGIHIKSEAVVETEAPLVRLKAGKLEMAAQRIVQSARELYAWFSGLWQLKSRRVRAVADTTVHLKGEEMHIRADKEVYVNGATVNLG